jgi:hypothetical protein
LDVICFTKSISSLPVIFFFGPCCSHRAASACEAGGRIQSVV